MRPEDPIRDVRTIDITGLDLQADGGAHAANTREVGAIKVVGRSNKRLRGGLVKKYNGVQCLLLGGGIYVALHSQVGHKGAQEGLDPRYGVK